MGVALNWVLAINAGSSSIKSSLFDADNLELRSQINITGVNIHNQTLSITDQDGHKSNEEFNLNSIKEIINKYVDTLKSQIGDNAITGIGHRIVHGGPHNLKTRLIDEDFENELNSLIDYDPEHLPMAMTVVEVMKQNFDGISQVACLDTAFYADMPTLAKLTTLPRKYYDQGVRRYGFHGLSYTYLSTELNAKYGTTTAEGRVIFAHLGSGASLTATLHGRPVDTTMGFTPTSGVMMSTRTGDIDPGLAWYLERSEGLSAEQFNHMANFESGLLGVSEDSGDMYTLIQNRSGNVKATEAVDLFCYQVKKAIGALTTTLGGLDTLVFSGGIGEPSDIIRAQVLSGLEFLGIQIDQAKNLDQQEKISTNDSKVAVYVIPTNENLVIAREVKQLLEKEIK